MIGNIISLHKSYGFIRNSEGETFYFSPLALTSATEFRWLEVGSRVRFSVREAPKGLRAVFVSLLEKPNFEWEEGALYVERAGKTFTTWAYGSEPEFGPGQRVLDSAEYVTGYYPSSRMAMDSFRAVAVSAGANFAQDRKVDVSIRLAGGFAVETYRCTGRFGVLVKPMKIKNPDELESLRLLFSEIIHERLSKMKAYKDLWGSLGRLAG